MNWGKAAKLVTLSAVYDPLPADLSRGFVADPSHLSATPGAEHRAELFAIGFIIENLCVVDMFDASDYV